MSNTPMAKIDVKKVPQTTDAEIVPAVKMQSKKIDGKMPGQSSIEDPYSIIRKGLLVIVLFFGVLGVWAVFSTIHGAVVAPGKVKIETERKTVQHLEGGIVDAILVKEGDEVTAGQTLLVLESIQVDASVDMLRKQLTSLLAAQIRYSAEKDLKTSFVWPQELLDLAKVAQSEDVLDNEMKIFAARREAIQGQVSMLHSQIAQIKAQIASFREQGQAEQSIIATLREELQAKRQLYKERYLEKSQILELERQMATHQGNRARLKQSEAEAFQRRDEIELRIKDTINRFVEDATNQQGRLDNEILQAREKIRPLKDAKTRLNVVAPVAGRVVDLKVHSKGGVVRAGEPLMDIVPADNPLIVEVQVPVNKITDIYIGQEAQVQLDAFDIRIAPMIPGKVVYISADRLEEKHTPQAMPYYLCYVEVHPESLADANLYLSPGMPATVFITTKETTVLFYMFEPLMKNWERALRD